MEHQGKKFHFQEIDWVICFEPESCRGKYRDYWVLLTEQKGGKVEEKRLRLGEVLDRLEIDEHYPHTVGYYKTCVGKMPEYLELREIKTVEEFWMFLNAANL